MISPIKFVSPSKEPNIFGEPIGDHLVGMHAQARRLISAVSPHKMLLQDLASG